ncbi:hypothetical protein [Salana multivorans]
MRPDLDDLLRTADPAPPTTTQGPAVESALSGLVASTRVSDPISLAARRPSRARRWAIPATVGLVLVGGTAAAGGGALDGVFDLFSQDSPVHLSTSHELVGGTGGCGLFVNVLPADGEARTDESGLTIQSGSAATFDQTEYDAVLEFVESHDWESELAGLEWENTVYLPGPNGGISGEGTVDLDVVTNRVTQVLDREGLNSTGSAELVTTASCGVSSDGSQPWSGS